MRAVSGCLQVVPGGRGRVIAGCLALAGWLCAGPVAEVSAQEHVLATPAGEWFELAGDTVDGQQSYALDVCYEAVDQPVERVGLEQDGVLVWEQVVLDTPSARGAADCAFSAPTEVVATALSEGPHTYRVWAKGTMDGEHYSAPWTVYVDRTPPAFESDFTIYAALDTTTNRAIINWQAAGNVADGDGADGAGPVAGYNYRYRRPGGAFSTWTGSLEGLERAEIPGAVLGDVFELEIVPVDDAGNPGTTKSISVEVDRLGSHCDNTANGAPSDCYADVGFNPEAEESEPEEGVTLVEPEGASFAFPAHRREINVDPPGEWATIRRLNQSYVIGNARDGWSMDVTDGVYPEAWVAGFVHGGYQDCGWVSKKRVPTSGGDPTETFCPSDWEPDLGRFASGVNCQKIPGFDGCTTAARTRLLRHVTDVDFCLNVSPTPVDHVPLRCENKVEDRLTPERISNGYTVGWRYVTHGGPGRRGRFVLVMDIHVGNNRDGRWGFIPRRAFKKNLCSQRSNEMFGCGDPVE